MSLRATHTKYEKYLTLTQPQQQNHDTSVILHHLAALHKLIQRQFDLLRQCIVKLLLVAIELTRQDLHNAIGQRDQGRSVCLFILLLAPKHNCFQHDLIPQFYQSSFTRKREMVRRTWRRFIARTDRPLLTGLLI